MRTLRKIFARHASGAPGRTSAVILLSAGLTGGCTMIEDFNAVASGSCIRAGQIPTPETQQQKDLRGVVSTAQEVDSGRYFVDGMERQRMLICYVSELDEPDECNKIILGRLYGSRNRIDLNPYQLENVQVSTLVHEGRHYQQHKESIFWDSKNNIRDEERIILNWLKEADARVSSVLFAHEKASEGDNRYMAELKKDSWHLHIVRAFEQSLAEKPDDLLEAMRAALMAFRDHNRLAYSYDKKVIGWIEKHDRHFDRTRPAVRLLTDELLTRLGDMGPYGNYMNDELKAFIRDSFTGEDYRRLVLMRNQIISGFEDKKDNAPYCG